MLAFVKMDPSLKILAFAGARELLGTAEMTLPVEGGETVAIVMDRLCQRYPQLEAYRGCMRVAVNEHYAKDEDPVAAGDELALIPPVAGG